MAKFQYILHYMFISLLCRAATCLLCQFSIQCSMAVNDRFYCNIAQLIILLGSEPDKQKFIPLYRHFNFLNGNMFHIKPQQYINCISYNNTAKHFLKWHFKKATRDTHTYHKYNQPQYQRGTWFVNSHRAFLFFRSHNTVITTSFKPQFSEKSHKP